MNMISCVCFDLGTGPLNREGKASPAPEKLGYKKPSGLGEIELGDKTHSVLLQQNTSRWKETKKDLIVPDAGPPKPVAVPSKPVAVPSKPDAVPSKLQEESEEIPKVVPEDVSPRKTSA